MMSLLLQLLPVDTRTAHSLYFQLKKQRFTTRRNYWWLASQHNLYCPCTAGSSCSSLLLAGPRRWVSQNYQLQQFKVSNRLSATQHQAPALKTAWNLDSCGIE